MESIETTDNIYTPKELNNLLLLKTQQLAKKFTNIIIIGDIKECRIWKRAGMSFKLYLDSSSIECKVWEHDGHDINKIQQYENRHCQIIGNIVADYYYSHKFSLQVSSIEPITNKETKLDIIKKKCLSRGYFDSKKEIHWNKIKTIGMISKKGTQGYNDFIKQFYLPINIILQEITLEGSNTYKETIQSILQLQEHCDIILIIRGGGSTSEISNSFDVLELFEIMKQSQLPIITAIGHEDDKEDKLLITQISDFNYPTPSTACLQITNIFLEPILNNLNNYLQHLEEVFYQKIDYLELKMWNQLKLLFESYFRTIFGGTIVSLSNKEETIIIENENKFYQNSLYFNQEISFTSKDINNRSQILIGLEKNDIDIINKHMVFTPLKESNNQIVVENIKDTMKLLLDYKKIKTKFDTCQLQKIKKIYCKPLLNIMEYNPKELISIKKIYLFYLSILETLEIADKLEIQEVFTFLQK